MASRGVAPDSNPLRTIIQKTQQKQQNNTRKTELHESSFPKREYQDDPTDNWRKLANCRGLDHHMFPRGHKDISYITMARRICKECEVREPCLEDSLQWPATDMNGVWAGLTPRQLAQEQKRRGITPSRPTIAQIWNDLTKNRPEDEGPIPMPILDESGSSGTTPNSSETGTK